MCSLVSERSEGKIWKGGKHVSKEMKGSAWKRQGQRVR
jgi:hypothetical protein